MKKNKKRINFKNAANLFKVISHSIRLKIIHILSKRKELSVNDIVAYVKISQPHVSQHLTIMRQNKIVRARREGKSIRYSLIKRSIYLALKKL